MKINSKLETVITFISTENQFLAYKFIIPDWLIESNSLQPYVITFHRWNLDGTYINTWHKQINDISINLKNEILKELEISNITETTINIELFSDKVDLINYYFCSRNGHNILMPRELSFDKESGDCFIDFEFNIYK